MNKLRTNILLIAITLTTIPFLSSCLDDDKDTPFIGIGTVKVVDEDSYYFLLDNNETIFPGNTTSASQYEIKNDARVVVYFYMLDETVTGYTYNGKIIHIEYILTKDAIPLTEETADSIGNDKINIQRVWFAGNCLNIEFQMLGTGYSNKKHMVNLVRNEIENPEGNIDADGYAVFEFRHNAYDDMPSKVLNGIVAFKEPLVEDEDVKGIKILYTSIYEGEKVCLIEN